MDNNVFNIPEGATINDYVRVDFSLTPHDSDAADLLASDLADIGFETFEHDASGAAMTAYVPATVFDSAELERIASDSPFGCRIDFSCSFVPGQDWNSEWEKHYFKPILVAGRVAVHSSFHTDVPEAEFDIVVDPRMAFGTGHHATTTLMMQALLKADVKGKRVIDMGTGTGILAILAAMLGAESVYAVEIDPFAADNARDNLALNLPGGSGVEIITSDASALAGTEPADLFLANINRNIITADIKRYAQAIVAGGCLVVSGFYVEDRPVIAEAAMQAGFRQAGCDERDNWSSMTFIKL
ncbi:MAG: 50S ribosomal protein L11 methyltransferase [Muribaculaceae bacterium]|nr:50S ribosomal protein L11 methyltransferase [Muribaculaceae bacterium]